MLRIGALELALPVVQAPLSGYSDLAMRRVARLCGAEVAFDEVQLDQLAIKPGKHRRRILQIVPDDRPLGGQLIGAEPETMARAADAMAGAGYDWIDVNLACPVRKVLARGRGGALLRNPQIALAVVRGVHEAVGGRCPVTVKLRRGWDDAAESEGHVLAILDGAFEIGIDAAIVHPRTVMQRYVGPSAWEFLARVRKRAGDRVILGSGDLFCAEDVAQMLEQTGVDGVTLARGCIGNPWIFRDCQALLTGRPLPPPPTVVEQGQTIARHLGWCVEVHGERRGSRLLRKFGIKYSELHPHWREVRDAIVRLKTRADWQAVLDTWYDPDKTWPATKRRQGPGDLVAAGAILEGEPPD